MRQLQYEPESLLYAKKYKKQKRNLNHFEIISKDTYFIYLYMRHHKAHHNIYNKQKHTYQNTKQQM